MDFLPVNQSFCLPAPTLLMDFYNTKATVLLFLVFIFFLLSKVGSCWQTLPDLPLPTYIFQLALRAPEAFPGQIGYIIPPATSGSTPPSWGKRAGGVHKASSWDDHTTSTDPFRRPRSSSLTPSSLWMSKTPHPISEAELLLPTETNVIHDPLVF